MLKRSSNHAISNGAVTPLGGSFNGGSVRYYEVLNTFESTDDASQHGPAQKDFLSVSKMSSPGPLTGPRVTSHVQNFDANLGL